MLANVGLLVLGVVALYFGAEWLVRGAAGLARMLGVSPLVVGLTVVSYGTSAPELAVSTVAALDGCRTVGVAFEDSLIGREYLRPLLGEHAGRDPSHAAGSSGDQNRLVRESHCVLCSFVSQSSA